MRKFDYTVTENDVSEALDIKALVRQRFTFSARLRSKIKRNKTVFLNGEVAPVWITPKVGDTITVAIPDEESYFAPEDIPFQVLYEDEDLLIIDKPAGYVVHPTKGHVTGTIANGVAHYMENTEQRFKIRFINRLDMDTSGVLLLGKNQLAQGELMKQMKADRVEKTYLAIVHGAFEGTATAQIDTGLWEKATKNGSQPFADANVLPSAGVIDLPLGYREGEGLKRIIDPGPGGKSSETHYRMLESFSLPASELPSASTAGKEATSATVNRDTPRNAAAFSMVELQLKSGRTHQIRVHMAAIGHSLVNDFLYGEEEPGLIPRQALHAMRIAFDHPVSKERLTLEAPLPEDFRALLSHLRGGQVSPDQA